VLSVTYLKEMIMYFHYVLLIAFKKYVIIFPKFEHYNKLKDKLFYSYGLSLIFMFLNVLFFLCAKNNC